MMQTRKPWVVLGVLCGLASAAIGISINTSGVFYSVVAEDLGMLRGSFAFHMTIFSLVTALSALFTPKFLEKLHIRQLLTLSVVVATFATGMMGMATQLWHFYILAAIRGFSTGIFSVFTITYVINHWFKKKNGLATSIALGFSGIMGAIMSPIFAKIIVAFGWRGAYMIEAVTILVLCLPALLIPFRLNPLDEGLKPYGYLSESQEERLQRSKEITSRITVIMIMLFAFLVSFVSSMTQHLPSYAEDLGKSVTLGASLLSMGMLGNILSKILVGVMSDWIGAIKATLILLAMNLVGAFLLFLTAWSAFMIAGALLFGSCYGLGAVSMPLVTKVVFGEEAYAKIFPIVSFAGNTGAALGFSIIGYIYDFTTSYQMALIVMVVMIVVATICLVVANSLEKRK
ncbi:MFS transporter [Streptococcus thoraltensis]